MRRTNPFNKVFSELEIIPRIKGIDRKKVFGLLFNACRLSFHALSKIL